MNLKKYLLYFMEIDDNKGMTEEKFLILFCLVYVCELAISNWMNYWYIYLFYVAMVC